MKSVLKFDNTFTVECFDKDGNLKWSEEFKNIVVDEGVEYMFDLALRATGSTTTWYVGLIENGGTIAATDTLTSNSWDEDQNYSEANRPAWGPGAAASRSITNTTTVDFSINATTTIQGIFLADDNTKGGTTGTLWAVANFSSSASLVNGDTLKITYTVSA